MTAAVSVIERAPTGLIICILAIALLGVLFLIYYALKHHDSVKAMFDCKLFNFSLETEKSPRETARKVSVPTQE